MRPIVLVMLVCVTAAVVSADPFVPVNGSLHTLPVAYYGANWNRTDENLEILSRLRYVLLLQEDGECWTHCCPNRNVTFGRAVDQCGTIPGGNSSLLPGCNASCDQIGHQMSMFTRIKAIASAAGRQPPHCVLYQNTVYLWPFDASSSMGTEVQLLDVNGNPHQESCDPGIFPSYFWDHSRESGRNGWLSVIKRAIIDGPADGMYADNEDDFPMVHCNATNCIAKRNGRIRSTNEVVTREVAEAYIAGKKQSMTDAAAMVMKAGGTWFPKQHKFQDKSPWGGNTMWIPPVTDVLQLQKFIAEGHRNYDVLVVGGQNTIHNPQVAGQVPASQCTETDLAAFLLAVPVPTGGKVVVLLCNGWDPVFENALGNPTGPATQGADGGWTRTFESGTVATMNAQGNGTVTWTHV